MNTNQAITQPGKTSRSPYWDIVKGIGIIAIVLGHSCYFAVAFVYLFHLALFFFISGYLYNEKKYGDAPFQYFAARLAGSWPRYMVYALIFILFHNFFVTRGLYSGQEVYNHTMMLTAFVSSISFSCPEQIQGALWFVPAWLVASAFFGGCVWFGRMMAGQLRRPQLKMWFIAFASIFVGLVGVFLNMRKCGVPYKLQTSLLVVPLYFIAWLMRLYLPSFKKYTTWYGCAVSAFLLYQINHSLHLVIELDSMTIHGFWFFPISLLGIYFSLSLAALMERLPVVPRLLAFLGRHSFDIMALHFTLFKLIDYAYARICLPQMPENLSAFPISFTHELWPVYLIVGVSIPALLGWAMDEAVKLWFSLPKRLGNA